MVKCNIYEKEFDSERGLHNHQSKVQTKKEEKKEQDQESEQKNDENQDSLTYDDGNFNLQLSTTHALLGVFLIGMVTGGFGHAVLDGTDFEFETPSFESDLDTTDTDPQPSGNQDTDDQPANLPDTETVSMDGISLEDEPVLGQSDAPVTMVVFEDYECPFCQRFEQGAVRQVVSEYVESGQVKIVWKDFPLPQIGHEWAEPAAAAMECVYREGGNEAFWNVKDEVFANQGAIKVDNVESRIKSYGSNQGVSESAVQSCIDSDNPMEEINRDAQDAKQIEATGTPTSVINGEKIVGAQPYDKIQAVIESQLNG